MATAKKSTTTTRTRKLSDPDPRRRLQDKEVRRKFLTILSTCGSRAAAAAALGFHADTVGREMERDGRFRASVEMNERRFEAAMLREHARHEKKDFRAIEWRLERKFPDDYGKRDPDTVTPEMLAGAVNSVLLSILSVIPSEHHPDVLRVAQEKLQQIAKQGEDFTDPFADDETTKPATADSASTPSTSPATSVPPSPATILPPASQEADDVASPRAKE